MRKTEIIKKYTEIYGKRPTLSIDKKLSDNEKFKIKQETKINQYLWTLKKQIFIEIIEKYDGKNDEEKISFSKNLIDKFTLNDLMKIYHGYRYSLDLTKQSFTLYQD